MVQRQRGGQSCLGGEWTPRLVRMHAEAPLHLIVAFCKGSEQVQRYSRVLCSSCLLAVSMLLFHFFSCSSCTLLEKCHRFFLFFFPVLGFACLAPDPGVVRLELTQAFPRFSKEQSPAFWCTRVESTVFSSRPLPGPVRQSRQGREAWPGPAPAPGWPRQPGPRTQLLLPFVC